MNKQLLTLSCLFLASCDDMVSKQPVEDQKINQSVSETVVFQPGMKTPTNALEERLKVYQTRLECNDGDVYKVSMSDSADHFAIYLNNELLITTAEMTDDEKAATREVALKMVENLRLIDGAESFLSQHSQRTLTGIYRQSSRTTLQTPRMKSRIRSAKERLIENVTEMMQILLEREGQEPEFLREVQHLKPQALSRKEQKISKMNISFQNER
ncbi:MAG: hypothetical protein J6V53_03040 [Alphaproteobacteria bacterium]|nr:hypothetical protein [Alphaproteobacteria bacterium]